MNDLLSTLLKNKKYNQNGQRKLQICSSIFDSAVPKPFRNSKCNSLYSFWFEYACYRSRKADNHDFRCHATFKFSGF